MTNPYQPPTTSESAPPTEPRFYGAGWWPIAILSSVIGGTAGGLFFAVANQSDSLAAPAILALGWITATVMLMCMIRDSKLSVIAKVLFALLLPIPAYILYVPVCVVSSFFTFPFLGQMEYGPTTAGFIVASAFAFFAVLMLIAVVLRARYRIDGKDAPTRLDK